MARKDWYYLNIRNEMADRLDEIVLEKGKVCGIAQKVNLRKIAGQMEWLVFAL